VLPDTPCCLNIRRISSWLCSFPCEEALIWGMARIWHLPSQVGEMHGCSFVMEHSVTIWTTIPENFDDCVTGVTPCRVFKSLWGPIFGRLEIPYFWYYSSDFSFFFLFTEELTLLRRVPDSSGSNRSAIISLYIFVHFLDPRFFWSCGCKVSELILLFHLEFFNLFLRFFKSVVFIGSWLFLFLQLEFKIESRYVVAFFIRG
jgi:hypothetical protein